MLDRPAAWWASAALTLAVASSCAEQPSYLVRWKLLDRDGQDVGELSSVKQCADVGISTVRVTTRRDGVEVDSREFSCFPGAIERGEGVEIPALPPGEYVVEVEGLRRSGEGWSCDDDEPCVAFAQTTVTIVDAPEEPPQVEVELLSPPECDDGIDNDRDGRVDGKDPGCMFDPTGPEDADSGLALFQTSVSFLGSPAVKPANVSVAALRLEVDGELLEEVSRDELDLDQWPYRLPLIGRTYDPGEYVFSIFAVDAAGAPLTSAYELPLLVAEDQAGYVVGDFDFGSEQFLAPIIQPFAMNVGLTLDPVTGVTSTCSLGGFVGAALERMWFRVTDEDGQPLDAATLSLQPFTAVDEDNGWISLDCPTTAVESAALTWGRYAVEIRGRIADQVCFTSGDEPLDLAPAPKDAQNFFLQRIVDAEGAPPAGCEECFVDSDCSGQVCVAGICKKKQ